MPRGAAQPPQSAAARRMRWHVPRRLRAVPDRGSSGASAMPRWRLQSSRSIADSCVTGGRLLGHCKRGPSRAQRRRAGHSDGVRRRPHDARGGWGRWTWFRAGVAPTARHGSQRRLGHSHGGGAHRRGVEKGKQTTVWFEIDRPARETPVDRHPVRPCGRCSGDRRSSAFAASVASGEGPARREVARGLDEIARGAIRASCADGRTALCPGTPVLVAPPLRGGARLCLAVKRDSTSRASPGSHTSCTTSTRRTAVDGWANAGAVQRFTRAS